MTWVKLIFGREVWVFISAYGPGSERGEDERELFWQELTECIGNFDRDVNVVLLGDLNAKVGENEIENIIGKYGVPGRNESGEMLVNMCAEHEMVIGNTWFKKAPINRYTWVRVIEERVVSRAL